MKRLLALIPVVAITAFLATARTAGADEDRDWFDRGVSAMDAKKCLDAVHDFHHVAGKLSKDESFLRYLANAARCVARDRSTASSDRMEAYDDAIDAWTRLSEKAPNDLSVRQTLSALREERAHLGAAIPTLTPQPTRTPDLQLAHANCLDQCTRERKRCDERVPSFQRCMNDSIQGCVDDCTSHYGYPEAQCRTVLCRPEDPNNGAWKSDCQTAQQDGHDQCSSEQDTCESACP